ncbi:MAG: hypothetical protein JJT81_06195 [Rubellimicrobium sp.]|nr:hypothetical protein [Rubellimicrobium sp.]
MLGLGVGPTFPTPAERDLPLPAGFDWNTSLHPVAPGQGPGGRTARLVPRALVSAAIWSGPAFHVDGATGNDANSGLGAGDGDFSAAKRTLHSAFVAGNATGAAYRVLVRAGQYSESAFTRNGQDEPAQPVAIIGWDGPVHYRTGPFALTWTSQGGTYSAATSSTNRVFRTDQTTEHGLYVELLRVADPVACAATSDSWCTAGSTVHVNIGKIPDPADIAVIRNFHGARFMTHTGDLYLENIHCEGGITGALHCDPVATRNIVGVNCSFRYSSPSNAGAPLDAVRIRRTNGLCAFLGSDASGGAKDGWNFHEDGVAGLHVLLEGCRGVANGWGVATSCNGFTTHNGVRAIVLDGDFGWSRNGTEVHCIQTTETWLAGSRVTARDIDGSSTAFKCSNSAKMWLQDTFADADGSAVNLAIEANGGSVFTRGHVSVSGGVEASGGGSVTPF